jgi:hypothetical protein
MAPSRLDFEMIERDLAVLRRMKAEIQDMRGVLMRLQHQAMLQRNSAINTAIARWAEQVRATAGQRNAPDLRKHDPRELHHPGRGGFDPNQPRVPAGHRDGGQWTQVAEGLGALPVDEISSARRTTRPPTPPPRIVRPRGMNREEQERFDRAADRYVAAKERIPNRNWEPKEWDVTVPGSIKGAIARMEAWASQAEAEAYRLGPRGNHPPPLTGPLQPHARPPLPPRPSHPSEFQNWMEDFRSTHNRPDLFENPTWPRDKGTVSISFFKARLFFGVSSDVPVRDLYTNADRVTATIMRNVLVKKYPDVMRIGNVGQIPNDALFHAEATILLRMARTNGGTLAGQVIEVHTDRPMCPHSCPPVLPKLGLELGNPMVIFVGPNGERRTMWNDRWLP